MEGKPNESCREEMALLYPYCKVAHEMANTSALSSQFSM
jgi:hypothetical protein